MLILRGLHHAVHANSRAGVATIKGQTGLMLAAMHGRAALLPRLLAAGAPLEARDVQGLTAFLWACHDGHAECVEVLLDAGCDKAAGAKGRTGLMVTAMIGHVTLLKRLLTAGVPLETRDEQGLTAFLGACHYGQAECVGCDAGCDAVAVTNTGKMGLALATDAGHTALLPRLRAAGQEERQRQRAAREEAERVALRAEAELMTMLQGEATPTQPR